MKRSRVHLAAWRRGSRVAGRGRAQQRDAGGKVSPRRVFPISFAHRVAAFRRGLNETGYVEGRNVTIEYHSAEGRYERFPELAAELVRRQVSVIVTPGNPVAANAAKAATSAIPIVFAVGGDPVKLGLVASLARPGGNVTGVNFFVTELAAKRLGLLRELVPTAVRVAVLVNPANPSTAEFTAKDVQAAARGIGLQSIILNASTIREIDAAYASLVRERADALLVAGDGFFNSRRVQLAMLAVRHAIPATYSVREYAEAGGLMSYGTSFADTDRQVGIYAGRILKGTMPADLPVLQSTRFELVINLQAARMLGLDRAADAARTRRRGDRMKRREFIAALGGAAAMPLVAARGAGPCAAHRCAHGRSRGRSGIENPSLGISSRAAELGLGHRPQRARLDIRWAMQMPPTSEDMRLNWQRSIRMSL